MTPLAWFVALVIVGVSLGAAWMLVRNIHRIAPPGRNLNDPPAQPCPKCDRAITHVVGRDHNHWTYACHCGQRFTGPRRFNVEGMG